MNREIRNSILNEILESKAVITNAGARVPLDSAIDASEGAFIASLISRYKPSRTIEIGCAQGIASTFICDELARSCPGSRHVIVDPHQMTDWRGIGVTTLRRAGLDNFELLEKRSEFALAELAQAGRKFDFALIDGWHTFDHTLLDFFYVNRMLTLGGVVVVDDVGFPAVKGAVRYVLNYPAYKLLGGVNPADRPAWKRFMLAAAEATASLTKLMGPRASNFVFNQRFLKSDRRLGIDGSMVALQKVAEDTRAWNWFEPF